MQIHLSLLLSDWLIYGLFIIAVIAFFYARKRRAFRESLRHLFQRKLAMISAVILGCYTIIGLLDSVHFTILKRVDNQYQVTQFKSLLDLIISPLGAQTEKTYSAPFATHLYNKSIMSVANGHEIHDYPRLGYGGGHLENLTDRIKDIVWRSLLGILIGLLSLIVIVFLVFSFLVFRKRASYRLCLYRLWRWKTEIAWREALIAFGLIWICGWVVRFLAINYHLLGTDQVGTDVLYEAIKSVRTGLLIDSLFMLPFSLSLGTLSGFFGGWVDDIIQYLYTTLSSIPGVLLIAASVLVLQVFIATHPIYFPTLAERADARLLALCLILGITSWANLCRLLRGETLKLREQEFVDAARVIGVSRIKIIFRHIFPNVMHVVLITVVLDFSALVLAEAVLSYVGVGVDPTTFSWGNMINSSRLELAREPVVWWPLLAALLFMFGLVLAANLFADALRDALDPRLRMTDTL
ncbi:ABC transporter permease [Coxiella burnetii]|uniref:ABC transporter permease n=1 Tax=Coxiella burnetii TaxID=777 RepID=UPI002175C592|nr:ABC transporter permease [Coxiella burnetii]